MFGQVPDGGESLHLLDHEIAVGHRVTNGYHFQSLSHQKFDDAPGGLAFTAPRPYCTDSDDRFVALDHGIFAAQQVAQNLVPVQAGFLAGHQLRVIDVALVVAGLQH